MNPGFTNIPAVDRRVLLRREDAGPIVATLTPRSASSASPSLSNLSVTIGGKPWTPVAAPKPPTDRRPKKTVSEVFPEGKSAIARAYPEFRKQAN